MKDFRLISTSILKDMSFFKLPATVREFGFRLLLVADDYGLVDADPAIIKYEAGGFDEGLAPEDIPAYLDALEDAGFLARYESGGKTYAMLHRNDNRHRTKPAYPLPPGYQVQSPYKHKGRQVDWGLTEDENAFQQLWNQAIERRRGATCRQAVDSLSPNKGMNEMENSFTGGEGPAMLPPAAPSAATEIPPDIREYMQKLGIPTIH